MYKLKNLLFILLTLVLINPNIYCKSGNNKKEKKEDKPHFKVGGMLRFNYRYMNWNNESYARINNKEGGEFLLDTYGVNVNGSYKGLILSLQYRFYAGYNMLHHGYIGYMFDKNNQIQLGVTKAPFGILPFASHNWFFSLAYYIGLEDNYGAGIKYIHKTGNWDFRLSFFKSSGGNYTGKSESSSRYSYDIVPESGFDGMHSNNRETNQVNARVAYKLGTTELGVSGEYGGLYNNKLNQMGYHSAYAVHLNGNYGRLNVMATAIRVFDAPKTIKGISSDLVVMGAYDFPFEVADKGKLYSLGVSYSVPVNWGPISNLTFYNDFSMYKKDRKEFYTSYHNITGFMITAGDIYTYVDFANGKNNPWLGQYSGLGPGVKDAKWKMRFNINIGYYF